MQLSQNSATGVQRVCNGCVDCWIYTCNRVGYRQHSPSHRGDHIARHRNTCSRYNCWRRTKQGRLHQQEHPARQHWCKEQGRRYIFDTHLQYHTSGTVTTPARDTSVTYIEKTWPCKTWPCMIQLIHHIHIHALVDLLYLFLVDAVGRRYGGRVCF